MEISMQFPRPRAKETVSPRRERQHGFQKIVYGRVLLRTKAIAALRFRLIRCLVVYVGSVDRGFNMPARKELPPAPQLAG